MSQAPAALHKKARCSKIEVVGQSYTKASAYMRNLPNYAHNHSKSGFLSRNNYY